MPTISTDTHTMRVNHSAADELAHIGEQVSGVLDVWLDVAPSIAKRTARTAATQVTQLFNMFFGAESTITRDGDLSIFVSTSTGFVYGLIGHKILYADAPLADDPRHGYAPRMGRFCFADVPGPVVLGQPGQSRARCGNPITNGERTCEGHEPLIVSAPLPIEWSFHS